MKKIIIPVLCAALALGSAALSACSGNSSSKKENSADNSSAVEATTEPITAAPATDATSGNIIKETDLTKFFAVDPSGDSFAGKWKITDGEGSQLQSFVYEFDGAGNAYLMVGTMGYIGTYALQTNEGKDVFFTQLMFGLNGYYTYKFADDKTSVVLTNIKDNTTSTLTRVDSYTPVPDSDDSPVIDEALLGAWKDDTGEILYFDKSGIFLDEQLNVTFTFYNYSTEDGKITQTYSMTEEITETATYKIEGDTLTYNDYEYQRISADELTKKTEV